MFVIKLNYGLTIIFVTVKNNFLMVTNLSSVIPMQDNLLKYLL